MKQKTGKRPRKTPPPREPSNGDKLMGLSMLVASALYLVVLWRAQSFLDSLEVTSAANMRLQNPLAPAVQKPKKYLVFDGFMKGQGAGNTVSGLLAAHLFGLEFDRIVCISEGFQIFHSAFESIVPDVLADCPDVLKEKVQKRISFQNFGTAPDECRLKEKLSSSTRIIGMKGNTYPRWPVIPDNFFFTFYKAKPELLKMLPYDPQMPPKTVVHLRAPDNTKKDRRKGLDEASLDELGKMLPSDTYLVTNKVEWFDYFQHYYHWKHPEWQIVAHSARLSMAWGLRDKEYRKPHVAIQPDEQDLQMFADWLTILTARMVYHTHSDFSMSAIHWQNIESKVIMGYNPRTKKLEFEDESWRQDGETPSLVDRKIGGEGKSELRSCHR